MATSIEIEAATPTSTRERVAQGVAIIACFLGLALGYACTYGATSTTFILPLTTEFGWGRFVPSLMYAGAMLGVVFASIWLGRIIERYGDVRVAMVSGICLAAVMVLMSSITGSPVVAITLAFLAGLLGAGTGVGLYVPILPRWFERHLGRALGISVIGQSAGAVVMPPISAATIATEGWRAGYLVLAAIELAGTAFVVLLLVWLRRHRDSSVAGQTFADRVGMTLGEAVRTRSFWLLQAAIFLQTLGMFGISLHLFPLYHDLGVGWAVLPRVTMAAAIGMAVGRLASGLLLDRLDPRIVAVGLFLTGAAAAGWLATLTAVSSAWLLYLPPALVGFALGSETDVLAYMARRLFGLRHYAVIYNRLLIGYFIGTMAGPLAIGWGFDHLAQPHLAVWGLAVSCVLAAATAAMLPAMARSRDGT